MPNAEVKGQSVKKGKVLEENDPEDEGEDRKEVNERKENVQDKGREATRDMGRLSTEVRESDIKV